MNFRLLVEIVTFVADRVQLGEGPLLVHARALKIVEIGPVIGLECLHQIASILESPWGRAEPSAIALRTRNVGDADGGSQHEDHELCQSRDLQINRVLENRLIVRQPSICSKVGNYCAFCKLPSNICSRFQSLTCENNDALRLIVSTTCIDIY